MLGGELLLILRQLLLQLEFGASRMARDASGGEATAGGNRLLSLPKLLLMGGASCDNAWHMLLHSWQSILFQSQKHLF